MQTIFGAGKEAGRDRREQESIPGCAVAGYSCGRKWRVLFTDREKKRFVHCPAFWVSSKVEYERERRGG